MRVRNAYISRSCERQFFMKRFSVKAIALGALVMIALDLLTGVVSYMVFGGDALQPGATPEEIRTMAELLQQNDGYLLTALVFGIATTILGGYVTARLARQLPLLNACALGIVGVVLGLLLSGPADSPAWFDAIGYIAIVPAAIFGGYLGRRARLG
jgi:hypothetical protein